MNCDQKNYFCYVCGLFVTAANRRNITKTLVECFEKYFVIAYVPNVWYAPEVVCKYCEANLHGINTKSIDRFKYKYVLPAIWLPRSEHSSESCYFCLSDKNTGGFAYKHRDKIQYATVESVL